MLVDQLRDPASGRHPLGAVGLDHQRQRVRDADRVGDLHLAAVGEAGRHHVLGHVARRVRGGAVHLRRVLAGERAAAVAGRAAVGVHDDLAPGEAGVAHRAADLELAGRVDHEVVSQRLLRVQLAVVGVQHRLDHVLPQVRLDQRLAVDAGRVLRRDQDLHDLDRLAVLVTHGDLRLAVGAQVRNHAALAHLRQPPRERVRDLDRHRHQLFRLTRGVAEHHSLVARTDLVERVVVAGNVPRLVGGVHALRDVGRLLVDRRQDRAGLRVEPELRAGVSDVGHRLAGDLRDVDVGLGRDLAAHHDHARGHERLARDAPVRVVLEDRVQHRIGDLVRDLVRVALGDRLGREQELVV